MEKNRAMGSKEVKHVWNERDDRLDEIVTLLFEADKKLYQLKEKEEASKSNEEDDSANYICDTIDKSFNMLEKSLEYIDRLRLRDTDTGKVFI